MKYITFIFFFILNTNFGVCQSTPSTDIIPYNVFLDTLDSLIQINEARDYSKNTLNTYHRYWREDIPKNYDKLINLATKKTYKNHLLVAFLTHKKGVYLYSKDEEAAIIAFKKALKIRQSVLGNSHSEVANSFYTIGITYKRNTQINAAITYIKKGLESYQYAKDSLGIIKCYEQLGSCYNSINEYKTAEYLYKEGIKNLKKTNKFNLAEIARFNNFIGIVKTNQKEYLIAYDYLKKAVKIYEDNPIDFPYNETKYYQNLAVVLEELGKIEEAKKANSTVLSQKKQLSQSTQLVEIYENIGLFYKNQNQIEKAFEYLQKALNIHRNSVKNKKDLQYNNLYHNLGATHLKTNNYPEALDYFQKAIQQQIINFNENDIYKNPDLHTANFLGTKPNLLKDFDFKANTFFKWYQESQNIEHLKAAFDTYIVASELIDLMRGEFTAKGSKLFWMEETYPIFERAIAVSLLLSEKTNDRKYEEQVFTLMEKNKAILLLESLQVSKNQAFANIPDSLLKQQQILTEAIANKKREINELQQDKTVNDSLWNNLESEHFQLELKLQDWEKKIEQSFPTYSQLTKNIQLLSLEALQSQFLSPNQAILEYFMGDSVVYLTAINASDYQVYALPKTSIHTAIASLQSALLAPQNETNDYQQSYQQYTQSAYQLYQLLVAPAQSILKNKKELIIIPDANLAAIPFDVLLQKPADKKVFYAADYLNYLINDFSISYGYSATLLAQQQQFKPQQTANFFMGFAPLFTGQKISQSTRSCSGKNLSPLPSNEQEVNAIAHLFQHKTFLAQKASKANFLAQAAQCRILHLATHACVDSENPAQSRIYFTDDYLYAHELYHLNLQADMVVLSACETGVGEYQKGEGVMNLARGFAYSGTPSITMSLWSVNDETTAQLMQHYYQHIEAGLPKHLALRTAKLDFLQNQQDKAKLHPFYWAAFVQVGNTSPIQVPSSFPWHWSIGLGLGLALLGLLFWGLKRNSRNTMLQ